MIRKTLVASLMFGLLTIAVHAEAEETRGLSVQLRASEATDAPIIETVELYSKSYALVIGNDNYRDGWARLGQARNDARKVAKALKARGFEVTLKTDLKARDLEKAFRDFFLRKGQEPDARLFVWYAGHGHTEDGEGYLIPVDGTSPSKRIDFLSTALSLRRFGEFVRLAESKHVFTIFDSCFAGTIFNVARANDTPPQITRITTQPVRQFLTSGDAGQTVADNGTFADLFVEALAGQRRADPNADGYLTASELGAFLDSKMSNLTNNGQTPRYGKLQDKRFDKGDFVFQLASVAPTRKVGSTGDGPDKETVFWQSIEDSKNPASFDAYLAQYPNGAFAALARVKLDEFRRTMTSSLSPPAFVVEGLDEMLVALRTANVRKFPTASSSKIGALKPGEVIEVTGKTRFEGKDWYRVAVLGRSAYVFGSLLGRRITAPAVTSPPKVTPQPPATPAVGVFPTVPSKATFISIGTGGVTGVYYPTGGAICRFVNRDTKRHNIRCSVESTGGSIYNARTIRAGELDFGIMQSDWQYHAYNGLTKFKPDGPFRQLRAVFSVHSEPVSILARADAGIRRFEDLKGHRVNIGNPGSGNRAMAESLMSRYGWRKRDFKIAAELSSRKVGPALCENKIDAFIFNIGHPSALMKGIMSNCAARFVSVTGPVIERLVRDKPYYRLTRIPGGLYRGNPNNVPTFGVGATFVTSSRVQPAIVYQVVKSIFDNFEAFKKMHPAFRTLTPQEMVTDSLTAPLHAGALKYYIERGWK